MKTKVLSYIFLAVAIGLGYYLYRSVKGPIEEQERITKAENQVIDQLIIIREAQKAHIKTKGTYARKWEELIDFVDNGVMYNIQLKEETFARPDRPWLGDSTAYIKDTLETLKARDVINKEILKQNQKTKADLTKFDSKKIAYKPGSNEKFQLYAEKVEIGNVECEVIEVLDTNPIDETRKEDNQMANRRPLRFGARDEVSTSGNWE